MLFFSFFTIYQKLTELGSGPVSVIKILSVEGSSVDVFNYIRTISSLIPEFINGYIVDKKKEWTASKSPNPSYNQEKRKENKLSPIYTSVVFLVNTFLVGRGPSGC